MHRFLRSVGFSEYTKRQGYKKLSGAHQQEAGELQVVQTDDGSRMQIYAETGRGIGISVYGGAERAG